MLSEPLMISSSQRSTGTVYGAGSSFFRSSSPLALPTGSLSASTLVERGDHFGAVLAAAPDDELFHHGVAQANSKCGAI